jgi:uncharacterized protein (TIGR03382 family)
MYLAAIVCLMGARAAWACDVSGVVVCEGTNTPVEGVVLTFSDGEALPIDAPATDAGGAFTVGLWGAIWNVSLGSTPLTTVEVFDINGAPVTLADPIEVPAALVPQCAPPTPACDVSGVTAGPFATTDGHPLGSPTAECAYVAAGSVPVGEGFDGSLDAPLASMDAAIAIVKSGRNYYAVSLNVHEGDALTLPATKNAVSHVTYCSCPPAGGAARAALSGSTPTAGGCSTGAGGTLALMGLAALLPRLRRRSR